MAGNSIGKYLVLTTFGESHGPAVGGILDGFPSQIGIDLSWIQEELNRRNPVGYPFSTLRKEQDTLEILSGIFEGKSTGTPIAFLVWNKDQHPEDYDHLKDLYRPSHADFTYAAKYGIRDPGGGGRASARTTLPVVVGGAFAKVLLAQHGIEVIGYVSSIAGCRLPDNLPVPPASVVRNSPMACPDDNTTREMLGILEQIRASGDTAGGIISCIVRGLPAGIGDPVFDKLQANLAKAIMTIPAVKGFEYGSGFRAADMKGSEHNDEWIHENGKFITRTNFSGGIQGGISNGMDITFRVAFKPVSTLGKEQRTVDKDGHPVSFKGKGRHDVCMVPRAVPIVEALAALVLADLSSASFPSPR